MSDHDLLEYLAAVQANGVGSTAAEAIRRAHPNDEDFQRTATIADSLQTHRAEVLAELSRMEPADENLVSLISTELAEAAESTKKQVHSELGCRQPGDEKTGACRNGS